MYLFYLEHDIDFAGDESEEVDRYALTPDYRGQAKTTAVWLKLYYKHLFLCYPKSNQKVRV